MASTKNAIAEKETLTFRLLDQIQQLYGLFCKRGGVPVEYSRDQVEEQLDFIKEEIDYCQDVLKYAKTLMADEKKSQKAEHGSVKKATLK